MLKSSPARPPLALEKFVDPDWTADGAKRARVGLKRLETLWINTGTLCNIACTNCYIESSLENDRLVYFSLDEATALYEEIEKLGLHTREIAFTGGEPFMNKDMIAMAGEALERGFEVLILTNAMQPMQRPRVKDGLLALNERFGHRLQIRISIDHYTAELHERERGPGTFAKTIAGMDWLSENGFAMAAAGRTCWGEEEAEARQGYGRLFTERGYAIDASDPIALVLFPEMDEGADVPEITTQCWSILGKSPSSIMCATSRMVVKRKGAQGPVVLPCTLIPYDEAFEMGRTLEASLRADGGNFKNGAVKLNHPHCARFCVLGGGACSAAEG